MSTSIQTNDLGLSILGMAQVDYVVGAERDLTYDQAVARVGLYRAVAVESAIGSYSALVKARQKKVEDIGNALAEISAGVAKYDSDEGIDQTISVDVKAYNLLKPYGLSGDLGSDGKIEFSKLQKLQTDVQYALDVSDNDIQQDSATLQGLVQKRDNAYSMATKLMKKANQTRSTGIRYIG